MSFPTTGEKMNAAYHTYEWKQSMVSEAGIAPAFHLFNPAGKIQKIETH